MALSPVVQLAPNVTPADANYPYGSSKNETAPGNLDGTPYNKTRADDVFGFQQALLDAAAIVPSGSADKVGASQYLQAVLHQALTGGSWVENGSGGVNTFVLVAQPNNVEPPTYTNGQIVIFSPNVATNTGACTVKLGALGVVALKRFGSDAVAGDFPIGVPVIAIYNSGLGWFEGSVLDRIINAASTTVAGILKVTTQALQEAAVDNTVAVTPGRQHFHPGVVKAWVNFKGDGVVAINASYNVSSITDHGVGDYTVNFTQAFADSDYALMGSGEDNQTIGDVIVARALGGLKTAAACRIRTIRTTGATDFPEAYVAFLGDQ